VKYKEIRIKKEKKSYNTLAKAKVRSLIGTLVAKHFGEVAHQLRILFLPGEENLETQTYYDLGACPKNMVGLERETKEFESLQAKRVGYHLLNTDVLEFTQHMAEQPFQVISLDLMGELGTYHDLLQKLVANGFVADNCVVYLNLQGASRRPETIAVLNGLDVSTVEKRAKVFHDLLTKNLTGFKIQTSFQLAYDDSNLMVGLLMFMKRTEDAVTEETTFLELSDPEPASEDRMPEAQAYDFIRRNRGLSSYTVAKTIGRRPASARAMMAWVSRGY